MNLLTTRSIRSVSAAAACAALAMARATLSRHHKPKAPRTAASPRHSRRGLSEAERQAVLEVLHQPRFADQPPAQVYAKLLDEGRYLCSVRTMHRLLAREVESGERRVQRANTQHAVPRLVADAPIRVLCWDIT